MSVETGDGISAQVPLGDPIQPLNDPGLAELCELGVVDDAQAQ